ncbi:MAG: maltose/maltodextrin ABC transporter substrate-binding protein MalE [Verrucomicrobia bacterium]|nr:maltose/maltodextrin ABC transporter substrate-binding protein MalE [Verrucomicrobiota bacterium]
MKTLLSAGMVVCCLAAALPAAHATEDGRLLVWINGDKAYTALQEIGDRFEADLGIPVKVQHPENPTDKFATAARAGKGPDILIWAHDRLGEWADSGLLSPIDVYDDYKAQFNPKAWQGFTHRGKIWGYPIAMESVALIYNKDLIDRPPVSLDEMFDLSAKFRDAGKYLMLWDYKNTYFTWAILAGSGAYVFGKDDQGDYDPHDVGVNRPGAVEGLSMIALMIEEGVMPKGVTYSVMDAKMNSGDCAMMISGPWAWSNLKKSGIDFGIATIPGVGGATGKPFVGVLGAMINRMSPNKDLAEEFLVHYVLTLEGLDALNNDVPLGVPAYTPYYRQLEVDTRIKNAMKNVEAGELMPNIPQVGRFWTAMEAALSNVADGQASPQDALDNAASRIAK